MGSVPKRFLNKYNYSEACLRSPHFTVRILRYIFANSYTSVEFNGFEYSSWSSGGSASGYNADGRGFAPHTGRPCLGSPSLNGYWPLAGNLTAAEKGTGHPTPSCR